MEMGRRSLAVRALVMLGAVAAVAAATIQPQASDAKPSPDSFPARATGSGRPQLAGGVACTVITANPLGVCPPPVGRLASGRRPTLTRCSGPARQPGAGRIEPPSSLCGSGFHAGDPVYLVAIGPSGSTFWRTVPDRFGAFKSALPSPLCRLTPATVVAIDTFDAQSNSLSIVRIPCPRS